MLIGLNGKDHYEEAFLYGLGSSLKHLTWFVIWGRNITGKYSDNRIGTLQKHIIWGSNITGTPSMGRTNTKTLSHTGWHKYENT